ncbi:hypothetical protein HDV00_011309 [Rhizophlyctis rosea]|nr:hypothetical protein HDV00_011309 [Rhizophlyctis rosea]
MRQPSLLERRLENTLRPLIQDWTPAADLYRSFEIVKELDLLWTKFDQFLWEAVNHGKRLALGYSLSQDLSLTGEEFIRLADGAVKFISTYIIAQILHPLEIDENVLRFLSESHRNDDNLPVAFRKFYQKQTNGLFREFQELLGVDLPADVLSNILDLQLRMSVAGIKLVHPNVHSIINVWERLSLSQSLKVGSGDGDAAADELLEWKVQEYEADGERTYEGLELVTQPAVQAAAGKVLKKGIGWRFVQTVSRDGSIDELHLCQVTRRGRAERDGS